jgi:hypothetical protein
MTKTLLLTTLVASALASTAFGTTTDELTLTSGATTVTILDNGAGDLTSAAGTVTYSNASFNGWNILITSGTSNSPTLNPFGIDIASLTATCNGGACATQSLKIDYSDINFNVPVGAGGFSTTFSSTQTGPGSTSESAWVSNSNTLFAKTSLIGTVGPFSGSNHATVTGGSAGVAPYSLTLEQVFSDATGGSVSFSVDGNITATPEPVSIAFLATSLIGVGVLFNRKRRTNS